jgi:hypothetical protein
MIGDAAVQSMVTSVAAPVVVVESIGVAVSLPCGLYLLAA